jgi:hypothetical protein
VEVTREGLQKNAKGERGIIRDWGVGGVIKKNTNLKGY